MSDTAKRIVIGITGASGSVYGVHLLEALKRYAPSIDRITVLTKPALKTISFETESGLERIKNAATLIYDSDNIEEPIASGSFKTIGMVVAPCSMKSLSNIALSNSSNLLLRSADVTLKERRKLVLLPRETPLHKGHLELMYKAADIGAIILPPLPSFYHYPKNVEEVVNQTIGKVLDIFDIEHTLFQRWGSDQT